MESIFTKVTDPVTVEGRQGGRVSRFHASIERQEDGTFSIRLDDSRDAAFWAQVTLDPNQFAVGDKAMAFDFRYAPELTVR
jgi:hypothetical protein